MSILVTGGTGVVGRHLVRDLAGHGIRPVVLDTVVPEAFEAELGAHCDVVRLDLRDGEALAEACRAHGVATIVHLAALTGSKAPDEPMAQFGVNMVGTMHVLEAARTTPVARVLLASTRTVYPDFEGTRHGPPDHVPVTEDHACDPTRPYEIWKYAAERIGAHYRSRFGLEVAAFRFAVYLAAERATAPGPGPKRTMSLLHAMLHDAASGTPVALPGGAERLLDLVYVKDLARCLRLAATGGELPSAVYNVGGGRPMRVRDIVEVVRDAIPGADVEVGPGSDFAPGHYCVLDIERARRELGYVPAWTPEDAIADVLSLIRARVAP